MEKDERWVVQAEETRYPYTVFAKGRYPLQRSKRRWKDNIKIDLSEVGVNKWTKLNKLTIEYNAELSENEDHLPGSTKANIWIT
jgi:hypothetical protein